MQWSVCVAPESYSCMLLSCMSGGSGVQRLKEVRQKEAEAKKAREEEEKRAKELEAKRAAEAEERRKKEVAAKQAREAEEKAMKEVR